MLWYLLFKPVQDIDRNMGTCFNRWCITPNKKLFSTHYFYFPFKNKSMKVTGILPDKPLGGLLFRCTLRRMLFLLGGGGYHCFFLTKSSSVFSHQMWIYMTCFPEFIIEFFTVKYSVPVFFRWKEIDTINLVPGTHLLKALFLSWKIHCDFQIID